MCVCVCTRLHECVCVRASGNTAYTYGRLRESVLLLLLLVHAGISNLALEEFDPIRQLRKSDYHLDLFQTLIL